MLSQVDSATVEEPCLALALDEWPLDTSDCTVKMLRDDSGLHRFNTLNSHLGNVPQLYERTDLFLYKLYLKFYFFLTKTGL